MNKYKELTQILIRLALVHLGIGLLFVAVFVFTDSLVDSSVPKKEAADNALKHDQGQIGTMTSQIQKSGIAEVRFVALQKDRDSLDFSVNSEALKAWLRSAKAKYRLSSNLKLSLTNEKLTDNKEIPDANYEVYEHPSMKLEFNAMSDTHVFAFVDDMVRSAPGFIRIESFSIKRTGDLEPNVIDQMRNGGTPYLVEAKIEFNWIGLKEKHNATAPAAAAGSAAAPAPAIAKVP